MVKHTIQYEGLELIVIGNYDEPEDETGYIGGWITEKIMLGDIEVSWMFSEYVLAMISDCVVIENY